MPPATSSPPIRTPATLDCSRFWRAGGYHTGACQAFTEGFTAPMPAWQWMRAETSTSWTTAAMRRCHLNVVPRSIAPGLAFSTPTPPGFTDTADGPLSAILTNLGNLPLNLSGLSLSNTNFILDTGTTTLHHQHRACPRRCVHYGRHVGFAPQSFRRCRCAVRSPLLTTQPEHNSDLNSNRPLFSGASA